MGRRSPAAFSVRSRRCPAAWLVSCARRCSGEFSAAVFCSCGIPQLSSQRLYQYDQFCYHITPFFVSYWGPQTILIFGESMEKAIDFCFRTEGAAGSVAPT